MDEQGVQKITKRNGEESPKACTKDFLTCNEGEHPIDGVCTLCLPGFIGNEQGTFWCFYCLLMIFFKTSPLNLSICFLNDFHQEQNVCCANKDIINQCLDKKKRVKSAYHPILCVKTRLVQSQQSPSAIVLNRRMVLICFYPLVVQMVLTVTI